MAILAISGVVFAGIFLLCFGAALFSLPAIFFLKNVEASSTPKLAAIEQRYFDEAMEELGGSID